LSTLALYATADTTLSLASRKVVEGMLDGTFCEEGDVLIGPPTKESKAYWSSLAVEMTLREADLGACSKGGAYKAESCMDGLGLFLAGVMGEEISPCFGSMEPGAGCSKACQQLVEDITVGDSSLCKEGDVTMIDSQGTIARYSTSQSKIMFPTFVPRCDFVWPSQDELEAALEAAKTAAPTMAPLRTVVEVEVKLGMSKDVWEENGEDAFKGSVSKSAGVEKDEVRILGVTESAGARRLTGGLEVNFEIDITRIVEKAAEAQVEATEAVGEVVVMEITDIKDLIATSLVEEIAEIVEDPKLVEELTKATGIPVAVEVLTAPKQEEKIVEFELTEEERLGQAELHDQGGGFDESWYNCHEGGGLLRCAPIYVPAVMLMCALVGLTLMCMCLCSSDERNKRNHNRHVRSQSSRKGAGLELEMEMGGFGRDSEGGDGLNFSAVNPMSQQAPPRAKGASGIKSSWVELVDEGSGRQYFENLDTGETSWSAPKEGFRSRLSILQQKKREGH